MEENKITIEKAGPLDAEEILSLQKLAYLSEAEIYNNYDIAPLKQTLKELINEISNKYVLKALIDENIIGSIRGYYENDTCYIEKLMVHPHYQNTGIGKKLMIAIENHFNYAKRYELFTGYKSEKNIYLYTKMNYKIYDTKDITENLKLVYLEKNNK